jgi:prepilin-type N-terminal cleavage/methylation domain-containing protein
MKGRRRGFTLVEIAVTVVIIGILAVIALVAYRRKVAASRTAEATNMITNIRAGQEAHKAETGVYANVSNSITSFYPATNPGAKVTQWGAPCNVCAGGDVRGWDRINVHADGPVSFGYATTAGIGGGGSAPSPAQLQALGPGGAGGPPAAIGEKEIDDYVASQTSKIGPTDPMFVALAEADHDEDGKKCHVLGLSHSNHIVVTNEGD